MTQERSVSNTHFNFEHKVFEIEGCYFTMMADGVPALHMRLGEMDVSVTFPQIASEFQIPKNSPDGEMLTTVKQALRFVHKVRPGDSIPSEIVDGTASWSVEDRHLEIAQMRLTMLLANWINGGKQGSSDPASLRNAMESDETKALIQKGFEEAAEKLGYGRHRKQEVADQIDHMACEMAYIEALKEQVLGIAKIRSTVQQIARRCRSDQPQFEELMRVDVLIERPLTRMRSQIEGVYDQTSEILGLLKAFKRIVPFVRDTRDSLRQELLDWGPILQEWKHITADPSDETQAAVKKMYQFLARNYQQAQSWAMMG